MGSLKNAESLDSIKSLLEVERAKARSLEELLDLKLKEVCDLNNSLNSIVESRTQQLNLALIKAEQLAKAKNQFLANMSHELRTPLNSIIGFVKILSAEDLDQKLIKEYLEKIEKSGLLLLEHVERIFEFSNLESSVYKPQLVDFNGNELANRLSQNFTKKCESKGLQLYIEYAAGIQSKLFGDEIALEKIISILLDNAIKYTEKGQINIKFNFEVSPLNGYPVLVISITDTGVGISEDKLVDVFAPFSQADNSDQRKYGGVGLGLTLASRLAQGIGAEIRVISNINKGSKFEVWYPLEHSKEPILNIPIEESPIDKLKKLSSKLVVLSVDDDETNNFLVKVILDSLKIKCIFASNGQEAVDIIALNPEINLVLMDCQMPVMNGIDAVRLIRSTGSKCTIVAVTANGQMENKNNCLAAGMNGFLLKPISKFKIAEAIIDSLWFSSEII